MASECILNRIVSFDLAEDRPNWMRYHIPSSPIHSLTSCTLASFNQVSKRWYEGAAAQCQHVNSSRQTDLITPRYILKSYRLYHL